VEGSVEYVIFNIITKKSNKILHSVKILCKHKDVFKKKGKVIPVTGHESPQSCETSRLPHLLYSWLTDGGEAASLTHRSPFTPQEDSWYSFLLEAELTPGPYCGWKDAN
jgi:hypothetical protein